MYHKQILLGENENAFRNDLVRKVQRKQKTSVDALTVQKKQQKKTPKKQTRQIAKHD